MSLPVHQVNDVHVSATFESNDADWISLPEYHLEFLAGVIACRMSMALARQGFASDIVHLAVESIEALVISLSHRSSLSEAFELCLSLFFEPHGNFPSLGVFPLEADLLLARTVDDLGLCCFDICFAIEIDFRCLRALCE